MKFVCWSPGSSKSTALMHVLTLLLTVVLCCNGVRPTSQESSGTSVTAAGHFELRDRMHELSDVTKLNGQNSSGNPRNEMTTEFNSFDNSNAFGEYAVDNNRELGANFPSREQLDQEQDIFDQKHSLSEAQTVLDRYAADGPGDELKLYELQKPNGTGEPGIAMRGKADESDVHHDKKLKWYSYFAAKETNPASGYVEAYIRNDEREPGYDRYYVPKHDDGGEQIVHLAPDQSSEQLELDTHSHGRIIANNPVELHEHDSDHDIFGNELDVDGIESDEHESNRHVPSNNIPSSGSNIGSSRSNAMRRMSREEAAAKRKEEGKGLSKRYEALPLEDPDLDRFIGPRNAAISNSPHPGPDQPYFLHYNKEYDKSLKHGAARFLKHSMNLTISADEAWNKIHSLQQTVGDSKSTLANLEAQVDRTNAQVKKEYEDMQTESRTAFNVAANVMGGGSRDFADKVSGNFETGRLDDDKLYAEGMRYKGTQNDLFKSDMVPQWRPLEVEDQFKNPHQWIAPAGQRMPIQSNNPSFENTGNLTEYD